MDDTRVSRRDWFRLRTAAPRATLLGTSESDDVAAAGDATVLRPVDQPPNHDGMNLAELPPMRQAELAGAQVELLFADIAALAEDITLMQRTATARRAANLGNATREQLQAAQAALLGGTLDRLQIRYRWQGALWIDTLERRPDHYRLVRIAHQNI